MISVAEAFEIILKEKRDFGTELIPFEEAQGRILSQDILADRDFPPFDRVTMDGIAIQYESFENGNRTFKIQATQSAGQTPIELTDNNDCIEIMTGAVLPLNTDTVIRYEYLEIKNNIATLKVDFIKPNQNVHHKGSDRKQGAILIKANKLIAAAEIGVMASVGCVNVEVKKLPKIVVLSTGDELVNVNEQPKQHQIRRSNNYSIAAVFEKYKLKVHQLHLNDNEIEIEKTVRELLEAYDTLILSGGVSMGKFDFLPSVLKKLEVKQLFHKIKQRPGKPFLFGKSKSEKLVFALPGNPVSSFMCTYRYVLPWLRACLGLIPIPKKLGQLTEDITFKPSLTYYMQVSINENEYGLKSATPVKQGGSGDQIGLVDSDAFMEMPADRIDFKENEIFPIIIIRDI